MFLLWNIATRKWNIVLFFLKICVLCTLFTRRVQCILWRISTFFFQFFHLYCMISFHDCMWMNRSFRFSSKSFLPYLRLQLKILLLFRNIPSLLFLAPILQNDHVLLRETFCKMMLELEFLYIYRHTQHICQFSFKNLSLYYQ